MFLKVGLGSFIYGIQRKIVMFGKHNGVMDEASHS